MNLILSLYYIIIKHKYNIVDNMNNIKWCAIQPLTGGMYIGAEEAIGHKAEFILSYPGLAEPNIDEETGKVISAGNEYSLMKFLEKRNDLPEYRVFNRAMFQNDNDMNPEIITTRWSKSDKPLDYSNMDLCVAVPVCSGLSRASATMAAETRDERNCNMSWITKYALNVIKPKCYIFENAPAMMNQYGDYMRKQLEQIAKNAGYSVCYYKTNTLYHHNAQKRLRTFILFFKQDDMNNIQNPSLGFEHNTIPLDKYLAMIPADATQQYPMELDDINMLLFDFYQHKFGNGWMETIGGDITKYTVANKLFNEINEYINTRTDIEERRRTHVIKFINHLDDKTSRGMGVFSFVGYRPHNNTSRAIMFKTIVSQMHPTEYRLMTIRENMWLMGLPHDFELQGDIKTEFRKIGQNVPVKTAKWIVEQALNAPNTEHNNKLVRYFDNVSMKEQKYNEAA